MLTPNTSYNSQSIELERERLRYMRCNTIIDSFLVFGMIIITLGMGLYFIIILSQGKSITIS